MKRRNRVLPETVIFAVSLIMISRFPAGYLRMLYFQLFRLNDPVSGLRMLFRMLPNRRAAMLLLYLLLLAASAVSAVSLLVRMMRNAGHSGKTKVEKKTEQEIETIERSFQTAYKSGRQRYIDQLDGFLQNGYLDQKGYRELKAKYQNMNIPDGF